tara:strand:- start:270 stop:443 length:174 start_codon:yes stop_codon:yes gene_type:complete
MFSDQTKTQAFFQMNGTRLTQECHPQDSGNMCQSSSVFTQPDKQNNLSEFGERAILG